MWVRLERRPNAATVQLVAARKSARLLQRHIAEAAGVSDKTVARWEAGLTHPSRDRWVKIVAFLAQFVPDAATELAALALVPSPIAAPPAVDVRAIEDAVLRAADVLDVSPRRARAALLTVVAAAQTANASLGDVARVLQGS
jgi:transcriptional regulator with XRE-family HTH domain